MILILQSFMVFHALAAEPPTYALSAAVTDLPAQGPARIALPPALVAGNPDGLASGLLLLDAAGKPVPYAVLLSPPDSTWGNDGTEDLEFAPIAGLSWRTEAAESPLDALVVTVSDLEDIGPLVATVRWSEGGNEQSSRPTLLYRLADGTVQQTVALPHVKGPFELDLRRTRLLIGPPTRLTDIEGVRFPADQVPLTEEVLTAPAPVSTEDGTARYFLPLGGVRQVRSVEMIVPDDQDAFERAVTVRGDDSALSGNGGSIRRLRIGESDVDRTEVSVDNLVTDRLVLEIATDRGRPLPVVSVIVRSASARLLVRNAGVGPHTLYAGATERASPYDLADAVYELMREETPVVLAQEPAANPVYVPLPTRTGVDAPGPDLRLSRFRFERAIESAPGWVRLLLDRQVLSHARPDLGDLRVVDASGRQVPFLLRATGEEDPWEVVGGGEGGFERTEDGTQTRLRILLDSHAPVATLSIVTGHDVFERQVTLLRDAGRVTVPIRRIVWRGAKQGNTLSIGVNQPVGGELLVRFENGDNPPLPIASVQVTSPRWEVRVRVPEGGARLVYGAPGQSAPSYDLSLLAGEVSGMALSNATLAAEQALAPPPIGRLDQGMTLIGIGLLSIGLAGMAVRVVRGVAPASIAE